MPELEVQCKCGTPLKASLESRSHFKAPYLKVEPCEVCMDRERKEGSEDGYEEALEQA